MEQAHRAGADDEQRVADLRAAELERGGDAGGRLGERGDVERERVGDGEDLAAADDGGGHEQGLGEAAVDVVAEGAAVDAAVALAGLAEAAVPAGDDRADDDAVALCEADDAGADLVDEAGDLVAGDDAGAGVLLASIDADVGGAERGGTDAEADLAGAGLGCGPVLDGDLAGLFEDGGAHTVSRSLRCGRLGSGRGRCAQVSQRGGRAATGSPTATRWAAGSGARRRAGGGLGRGGGRGGLPTVTRRAAGQAAPWPSRSGRGYGVGRRERRGNG